LTRIYHPSVNENGNVWIPSGILVDSWSPAVTIGKVLQELISMLEAPNTDDPLDAAIAQQVKTNRAAFDHQARDWTAKYAEEEMPSSGGKMVKSAAKR
jgi:ubiquitin-conjugating enzyme E2 D